MASSKNQNWGGKWTEEKLDTFQKYVQAYLTIMNNNRDKYNWKIIYFDGFAGSGSRQSEGYELHSLIADLFSNEQMSNEDAAVYLGSAARVLSIPIRGFDAYYFVDKNPASIQNLSAKLELYKENHNLFFCEGDANDELKKLGENLSHNRKTKALVMLDPFGMQINWNSIQCIAQNGVDLWILVPTGVIINRLLDKKGELTHIDKLCSFFGCDEAFIKSYFYRPSSAEPLLFDYYENERITKVNNSIELILNLYISKLKDCFQYVTEKPLVMRNTRNVPIYHFVFASFNAQAKKIAHQIIAKKTRL